jgi:hypothetical protein
MPLTAEEKDAILAKKAATKAAKKDRRSERLSFLAAKSPVDFYIENPMSYWIKVVDVEIPKWTDIVKAFENARRSVHECDTTSRESLEMTMSSLVVIIKHMNTARNAELSKNEFLKIALELHSQAQIKPSEELQSLMTLAQQQIPRPAQEKLDEIMEFYSSQMERLQHCLQEVSEREKRELPANFINCLDIVFPDSCISKEGKQRMMLMCTIVKLLSGQLTLSAPTCDCAKEVSSHVDKQLEKRHNIDGSKAVKAKICAEQTGCLDCMGAQARNVILLHKHMDLEAFKKMLHSLLTGHKTAYEAFKMFCKYWYEKKPFEYQQMFKRLFGEHVDSIDNIVQKIGFSDEQRTEIVRLMLEKLSMTIEEIDSYISAFLENPSVFP